MSQPAPSGIDPRVAGQRFLVPRFSANGVDHNEADRVLAGLERWEDWAPRWKEAADAHRARGLESLSAGRPASAAQALLKASAMYHFGSYLSSDQPDLYAEMGRLCADSYRLAGPLLDPPVEFFQVPYQGASISCWLRRPRGTTGTPVVLLIPGLDARKEELHGLGEALIARGVAAVGIDGPGQGETEAQLPMQADYAPVLDAVRGALPGDLGPIGVLGVSLGAYWAPRATADLPWIKACVAICGPFDWSRSWEGLVPLQKRVFWTKTGSTPETAFGTAQSFTLAEAAPRITVPLLVVHAGQDTVILPSEGEDLAAAVPGSELVIYDDATHVCHNRHYLMRPLVADWLAEHLRA